MARRVVGALALVAAGLLSGCGVYDSFFGEDERLGGERVRIREQLADRTPGFGGTVSPIPEAIANADWTQTNAQASHASGHLAAPAAPSLAWRADIGSGGEARLTGAPIVVGGRVYTLDADASLVAFDARTGSAVWRRSLAPAGEPGRQGFGGGLASDGTAVYATTGFGEILAVDAASGEIAWRHRTGAPFRAAPAVSGGVVLAVTRDNRAVALATRTGEPLWRIDGMSSAAGLLGGASPAISGDLAVIPFASGEVMGIQLSTGRRVWSAVLGGARRGLARSAIADVTGDPVIAGRAVVAANQSGRTVAVDGQTGNRGWTRSIGAVGPIWAAGTSLYMVTDDSALVRLSLEDGETIWRTELPAFADPEDRRGPIAYSGPVLAGGRLLVTDSRGTMLSFDPATGEPGATLRLADGSTSGAVVAGNTIYVLSQNGALQAFR